MAHTTVMRWASGAAAVATLGAAVMVGPPVSAKATTTVVTHSTTQTAPTARAVVTSRGDAPGGHVLSHPHR